MIGVAVREEDGVDAADVVRQRLRAQVGPGVDQQRRPSSSVAMRTEGRSRLSRGSVERQVAQSQPIIGTPCDVPVPRNVILQANGVRAR